MKKDNPKFDVSMGAYDGAEVCEVVGLFILSQLQDIFGQKYVGLYRDDGLGVLRSSGPEIERIRKKVHQLFKDLNLKVTIEANMAQTDFLDLLLNLNTETYRPYRKKNEVPLYISAQSNHPPMIKKHLPDMIATRVSNLSSSRHIFENECKVYNHALIHAGYRQELQYNDKKDKVRNRKRKNRNILWYNPPFSQNVKTNVAKTFLALLTKHFEKSELNNFFNRKTVKVSYSCMANMEAVLKGHNQRILTQLESTKKI